MMLDIWQQLQSFMGRGGPVLWVILALLVLMWILMIERLLYLNLGFAPLQRQLLDRWQARSERHSWHARAIRGRWLAEAELELNRHLIFIRTLVVLCPMLGLLGTVTGMIGTFQAITQFGTGDPKIMAGGISMALVTTVQGLVAAIPLILAHSLLQSRFTELSNVLEQQVAGILAERAESNRDGMERAA